MLGNFRIYNGMAAPYKYTINQTILRNYNFAKPIKSINNSIFQKYLEYLFSTEQGKYSNVVIEVKNVIAEKEAFVSKTFDYDVKYELTIIFSSTEYPSEEYFDECDHICESIIRKVDDKIRNDLFFIEFISGFEFVGKED